MNARTSTIVAATALALAASAASAGIVPTNQFQATITADNHYALFTGTPLSLTAHGHNELGPGGDPGPYNWSVAENYTFTTNGFIYIAAWSDDAVAQGVLARITRGGETFHSGDARWEVFTSGIDRDDNAPAPTIPEMSALIITATLTSAWQPTFVGGANGVSPWGTIAGIGTESRWMWANVAGVADPTQGGRNAGEMLIFRMNTVPTPGAAALLGIGGLVATRRRR